jgi:ferritin
VGSANVANDDAARNFVANHLANGEKEGQIADEVVEALHECQKTAKGMVEQAKNIIEREAQNAKG